MNLPDMSGLSARLDLSRVNALCACFSGTKKNWKYPILAVIWVVDYLMHVLITKAYRAIVKK